MAWLLAYLIYPVVYFIQKKLKVGNKSISILLALTAIGGIITFLVCFFAPQFVEEAVKLKNFLVEYSTNNNENGIIPHRWEIFLQDLIRNYNLAEIVDREDFLDIVKSVSPHVWSLVTSSVAEPSSTQVIARLSGGATVTKLGLLTVS